MTHCYLQVDASFSKTCQRLATQRKSTQVDRNQLYMRDMHMYVRLFAPCVNLRADLRRLATHPAIASPSASSGFANLRRLASPRAFSGKIAEKRQGLGVETNLISSRRLLNNDKFI